MHLRKILVPTDFSDSSDAALVLASSLARDNNAKLIIVHVQGQEVVHTGFGAAYAALPQEQRADAQVLLEKVFPANPAVDFERRFLEGSPGSVLVEVAKEDDAIDLIVMGTHGRSGLSRLLMGSVAETVLRDAPCPVLTIKEASHRTAATSE